MSVCDRTRARRTKQEKPTKYACRRESETGVRENGRGSKMGRKQGERGPTPRGAGASGEGAEKYRCTSLLRLGLVELVELYIGKNVGRAGQQMRGRRRAASLSGKGAEE